MAGIEEGGEGVADWMEMQMDDGAVQDFAELYEVHAAITNPLQRGASKKLAWKVGGASDLTGNM